MRWARLLLAVATAILLIGCQTAGQRQRDRAAPAEQAERGLAAIEAQLATIEAQLAALPADGRLTAWRAAYTATPRGVLLGERYGYYYWTRSRFALHRDGPQLDDPRPIINDASREHHQIDVITCVDLRTGQPLWMRRLSGWFRYCLGPDDHLLAQASRLIRLDAASGEVTLDQPIGPKWHEVGGVIMDRAYYMHEQVPGPAALQPWVFDVDAEAVVQLPYRPVQLAGNRLRTVRTTVQASGWKGSTTVACTTPDGRSVAWTRQEPVNTASDAVWLEGDVLLLSGTAWNRAQVSRLGGEDGAVQWSYPMPNGAWSGAGGAPAEGRPHGRRWSAVGVLAGHVAAIGGQAELHLLDRQTGQRRAIFSRAATHLAFPRQVGDNIVIADHDALVGVPLKVILGQQEEGECPLLVRKGRALLALGRIAEARDVATILVLQAPDAGPAWDLLAEVAEASQDTAAVAAARVRAMQVRGQQHSPQLLASHGLVGRIDTGAITAHLALLPPVVYGGTVGGELLRIDPYAAEVVERTSVAEAIDRLGIVGSTLFRVSNAGEGHPVTSVVGRPAPAVWPDDGFGFPLPADSAPPVAWHARSQQAQSDLHYNGRTYRPLPGGRLQVVEQGRTSVLQSPLEGLDEWHLYHGPGGLLGYGRGGVYRLDAALLPVERIIDVGGPASGGQRYNVPLLASDGQTLCIVVHRAQLAAMQIWTIDGRRKLREETVAMHTLDRSVQPGRLIGLDSGYFFSGRELAWVAADPERPAWRFHAPVPPTFAIPLDQRHFCGFGVPRVIEQRLLVAWKEGDIFVFDTGRITAAGPGKAR